MIPKLDMLSNLPELKQSKVGSPRRGHNETMQWQPFLSFRVSSLAEEKCVTAPAASVLMSSFSLPSQCVRLEFRIYDYK